MPNKSRSWSNTNENTIDFVKRILSNLSIKVRADQFNILQNLIKVTPKTKVLDVGISPNETLPDTNIFERIYPYPQNLTAVSIEDCSKLKKKYPKVKILKIIPNSKLPFRDKQFDLVTAWATLEHVGDYRQQEVFINELLRVGKRVFLTTPYRGCPYEPHTGTFLLHYLPLKIFRWYLRLVGKTFMSQVSNLNPLWVNDLKKFKLIHPVKIKVYKTLSILHSHLIIWT